MKLSNGVKIIYEDEDVRVLDKPAGVNSDDFEKRVHRLDKDTSGIFLVAKNDRALDFLQKQFKERKVKKNYLALVIGNLKNGEGIIETLIGRSPKDRRKQKVYLPQEPAAQGKREAITRYKVLQRFKNYTSGDNFLPKAQNYTSRDNFLPKAQNYDLIEVEPKTGRKHQIRAQLAWLSHPIAGDKLYSFKNQPCPQGLKRQFLHASYLKINLPDDSEKEFRSELPEDLKKVIESLTKSQI